MFFCYALLIFTLIESFGAHKAEIDINRLRRLPNEAQGFHSSPHSVHGRRSAEFDQVRKTYDYDDYSGGLQRPPSLSNVLYPAPLRYPKDTLKIHQPRENPRLYYQSDAYVKELRSKNVNTDVAAIYPGREVVRFDAYDSPNLLLRKIRHNKHRINPVEEKCIRCPRDRTLIVKAGSDRVVLQTPRLVTCSGQTSSSNVKFVHMYGPSFESVVKRGSHVIVGRITYNDQTLHLCKMEVHVIVQSCPVPKHLVPQCDQLNRVCNFTCKDSDLEIFGETSLICGNNMEWESKLPVCRVRRWCPMPIPPEHGRISCKGKHMDTGTNLIEGSKCRIRCASEWHPTSRGVAVCRRGVWTHNLQCQSKSRYPK